MTRDNTRYLIYVHKQLNSDLEIIDGIIDQLPADDPQSRKLYSAYNQIVKGWNILSPLVHKLATENELEVIL